MFTGRESQTVDPNGRMSMPTRFRSVVLKEFDRTQDPIIVALPWFGECVRVYSLPRWERHAADFAARLSLVDNSGYGEDGSDLLRLIYGMSVEAKLDGHGRFVLPQALREEAGIEREISWVGLGDFLEIWDPTRLRDRFAGDNAKRLRARLVEMFSQTPPSAVVGAPEEVQP